ncbi:MAG: hypothetical protein WCF79_08380 [Rhodomicrobium sp.]
MSAKPLKTRDLILSLSKDEAKILRFFAMLWAGRILSEVSFTKAFQERLKIFDGSHRSHNLD